jgi:PhzF family phenazine biosynthesis protein
MPHNIKQVNAFTADGKNGNPAGVVLDADELSEEQMLAITARAGFSETAFVSASEQATYKVRFFTPTEEVDLCGHATIATWSFMYEQQIVPAGNYTQETLAGILGVSVADDGLIFMEQAKAEFYDEIPTSSVAPLLGIAENELHPSLKPQIVSTGLRDLLVPLKDDSILARLQPEFGLITDFSKRHNITGLHVFSLKNGPDSIADARNFAPAVGIPEECATGTSNGALLCYLKKHNALPDKPIYRIEQGKAMHKLSYIHGKFVGEKVWIGGRATCIQEKS